MVSIIDILLNIIGFNCFDVNKMSVRVEVGLSVYDPTASLVL